MAFSKGVWDQLENIDCASLERALKRDGWTPDARGGSIIIYLKLDEEGTRRVSIHRRAGKTFGRKLLQGLLDGIGWTEDDLKRLKLIQKGGRRLCKQAAPFSPLFWRCVLNRGFQRFGIRFSTDLMQQRFH